MGAAPCPRGTEGKCRCTMLLRAAHKLGQRRAVQWKPVPVDDFLVTVKIRVTVTDPQTLLRTWQARDPRMAESMSSEPELSLTMAVQDAVKPPDLSAVPGVVPHEAGGLFASVRAEPWTEWLDPC